MRQAWLLLGIVNVSVCVCVIKRSWKSYRMRRKEKNVSNVKLILSF